MHPGWESFFNSSFFCPTGCNKKSNPYYLEEIKGALHFK